MRDIRQNSIQSSAFVISVCISVLVSLTFVLNLTKLESPAGAGEVNLESRINPNVASAASLVRLPDIGLLRAGAIVAYRDKLFEADGEKQVFQDVNDLQKVKGIGPKTAQNISQWLIFE
jgi:competence ComEA-like helix-hairpin-helix protein